MDKNYKIYQIRFNTHSTDDSNRWRLLCDGEETLVSNIIINSQTYTTKDYIKGVGDKWHVTCCGDLTIKDNIAYIDFKKDNVVKRHIYKTITYRILGTLVTVIAAILLGAPLKVASILGIGELILKPIIYFAHERIWYKFGKLGR